MMENFNSLFLFNSSKKKTARDKTKKFVLNSRFFFVFTSFILVVFILGCSSFYKVNTIRDPQAITITSLQNMNKSFVVHADSGVFIMQVTMVGNDSVIGNFKGDYNFPYKRNSFPEANSTNRYWKKKGDSWILNEVHFYTENLKKTLMPGITRYSFAFSDITQLDIYNKDEVRTTLSWIAGIIGGLIGGYFAFLGILLLIIAIGGGSCPYIYVNNGTDFVFVGEIYSGAVYAPLERNDYLFLPGLVSENGKYLMKISNELQEVQHTNLTELLVFDHPENIRVLVDKYGNCQTSAEGKTLLSATNLQGTDILDIVRMKDSVSYCGEKPVGEIPLTDGMIMTFDLKEETESVKLFIRARNSIWLDHAFKEFHGMLGSYQDAWTKKQDSADPQKFIDWSLDQKIPLSVYVEKNGKWVFCDYFNMAGPMALKDDVLTLDVDGIGKGLLKVRLESGFSFWEIDYVAMDCSSNYPVREYVVSPDKAVTEDGDDVTSLLKGDDAQYYVQSEVGNVADLSFPVPASTEPGRTIILHSKGYYHINSQSGKMPQLTKLTRIRRPGKFLEYSRDLMKSGMKKLRFDERTGIVSEALWNE